MAPYDADVSEKKLSAALYTQEQSMKGHLRLSAPLRPDREKTHADNNAKNSRESRLGEPPSRSHEPVRLAGVQRIKIRTIAFAEDVNAFAVPAMLARGTNF